MTKSELIKDIENFVGGRWINVSELATYLGYKDRHSAQKFVKGLTRVGYRYSIVEVAENVMGQMK